MVLIQKLILIKNFFILLLKNRKKFIIKIFLVCLYLKIFIKILLNLNFILYSLFRTIINKKLKKFNIMNSNLRNKLWFKSEKIFLNGFINLLNIKINLSIKNFYFFENHLLLLTHFLEQKELFRFLKNQNKS